MKTIKHQAFEPQILYTRLFKRKFDDCIGRHPSQVKIVVPYIGKTPWGGIIDFAKFMIKIQSEVFLTTLPPNNSRMNQLSQEEAKELSRMGINLIIRTSPPLHSKIYQFIFRTGDRAAFVGSANFSINGFNKNDETVAFFQAKADNDKIANEIDRLSAGGATFFNSWR